MPDLSAHFHPGERPPGSTIEGKWRRRVGSKIQADFSLKAPVTLAELRRVKRLRGFSVLPRERFRRLR
jgi:hypothetical protein